MHSLALTSSGGLIAWGANESGQLGLGAANLTDQSTPVAIPSLAGVKGAAAGRGHSVALTANASLFAWGDNRESGLGVGSATPVITVPSAVLPVE
jgi:alpha-tubulin suppressor-like RCC1 family protein